MCYMSIDGVYNSCVHSLYIRSVNNPIFTHSTLLSLTIENGLVIHCIKLIPYLPLLKVDYRSIR